MPGEPEPGDEPRVSVSFLRSLPLFIASGLFFVFGAVVYVFDPHYGPGSFTLWALLLVLGFVAAIGGVASWLLVAEPEPRPPPRPKGRRWESPAETAPDPEPGVVLDRAESGRPAPAVRERATSPRYVPHPTELAGQMPPRSGRRPLADWDETDATETPVTGVGPGYASASEALRDLDGIEEELVPRTTRARPAPLSG